MGDCLGNCKILKNIAGVAQPCHTRWSSPPVRVVLVQCYRQPHQLRRQLPQPACLDQVGGGRAEQRPPPRSTSVLKHREGGGGGGKHEFVLY